MVIAAAVPVLRSARDPVGPVPSDGFEALRARSDIETSSACLPCHPDHHATWARTHHAKMTRDASAGSIVAPFDGEPVTFHGVTTIPRLVDGRFVMDTLSPVSGERETLTVARVTGSRRMQQFHVRDGDRLVRLPVAWSIAEGRWFHLDEAFFHEPGAAFNAPATTWNTNCIFCHDVAARPGLTSDGSLATTVGELGIACEACHGPGEEHAKRMRSPLRRYAFHATHVEDPTIVNPGRLSQERSVQVCGRCHGQRVPTEPARITDIMRNGDGYVPGEDLTRTWTPVQRDTHVLGIDFSPRFWRDGSPRLTAYEQQGLMRSDCYVRGGMTCLSCHAMHASDPEGQMRRDVPGDAACTQCHSDLADRGRAAAHSRHAPDSSGSRCIACHMPPVVYGVMTWHPTHEIVAPDPGESAAADKPDACTSCHAGRSRAWADAAADRLWPSRRRHGLPEAARGDAPELARALFAGDAVYRAFAAWRLGAAPETAEPEVARLAVPLLGEALLDPFANVRRTAALSLDRLGRRDVPRALEPEALRRAAREALQAEPLHDSSPGWPVGPDGMLDREVLAAWISSREEVPFSFGE